MTCWNQITISHATARRSDATRSRVARLVARIYDQAPPELRGAMLEHLLRPLSALSTVAIAGGVFARIWFRHGWGELHLGPEDAVMVSAAQVAALVEHVAQTRVETLSALSRKLVYLRSAVRARTLVPLIRQLGVLLQRPAGWN